MKRNYAHPEISCEEAFDDEGDLAFRIPTGIDDYSFAFLDREAVQALINHLQKALSVPNMESLT